MLACHIVSLLQRLQYKCMCSYNHDDSDSVDESAIWIEGSQIASVCEVCQRVTWYASCRVCKIALCHVCRSKGESVCAATITKLSDVAYSLTTRRNGLKECVRQNWNNWAA